MLVGIAAFLNLSNFKMCRFQQPEFPSKHVGDSGNRSLHILKLLRLRNIAIEEAKQKAQQ